LPERTSAVGVFLCDCGGEISGTINFEQLKEFASKLEGVKWVKRHSFLCGDQGRSDMKVAINGKAERIVIAACSPKLYENFFRRSLADDGFNPFFLEMANIREQCAWAHPDDPPGANEKAKRLVAAAVEKARGVTAIERKEFQISKSVLVVGAGVAGIRAAMGVADFGYPVHLIEKAPIVGGNALKLGLAFPTNDGAFCVSSPLFLTGIRKCFYRAGLLQHPNIKLYTLSEVEGVKGSFGNFDVEISSHPRGIKENLCINCGKCADVCPIDAADEMNYGLNKRKAIYLPYPNAVPPVYVIDWKSCNRCGKCVEVCPTKAVDLYDEMRKTTLRVGAIIVATGFQEYDPSEIKPYQYGVHEDVVTQLQLARILDPYGPTGGKLIRPSDGKVPKNIVMIQCVGSRDTTTNPYCSRVCCTIALKHALHLKEQYRRDVEIYFCYMDIRTVGKDYEEYFSRAREMGVRFIRGKPSSIFKDPISGSLVVEVEDTLLNRPLEIEADMVVLSVGMVPTTGNQGLAKVLGIEINTDGFVKELYPKLKPVETTVKGIYVCGGAHGPKDIPDSVTQAEASAFRVILDLSRNGFEKDMDIAYVKEDYCDGCELCVEACPYDAIEMMKVEGEKAKVGSVARINEILCDRCGSCASRCPTGAVQLHRYTDDQVLGQISKLLSKYDADFSPMIVAFCCDECGYATVDLAGMGRVTYPANVLPIRVPCLGWVSLYQIFRALEYGADGILLVGCMPNNCQHLKGDVYAERVVTFAQDILDEIGLDRNRLKMVSVCAADPAKFCAAAGSLVDEVRKLGPITKSKLVGGDLNG